MCNNKNNLFCLRLFPHTYQIQSIKKIMFIATMEASGIHLTVSQSLTLRQMFDIQTLSGKIFISLESKLFTLICILFCIFVLFIFSITYTYMMRSFSTLMKKISFIFNWNIRAIFIHNYFTYPKLFTSLTSMTKIIKCIT
jgi:hypothetical protein